MVPRQYGLGLWSLIRLAAATKLLDVALKVMPANHPEKPLLVKHLNEWSNEQKDRLNNG